MHTYQAGSSPEALARDTGPTGEAFPLAALASAIAARRLLILAVALAAAAVGFVWASLRPAAYDAHVVLMVTDSKMREGATPTSPASFTALLANRAMAQRIIAEFDLGTRYGLTPAGFLNALKVDEIRNSPLVTVRVRLDDPQLATKVANRFAELAVELNRSLNQKDTAVARDLIKAQLDEAATRLESARASMLAFRRESKVELSKADIAAVLEQRQELSDWLVLLAAEKARLAQLERDLAAQPPTVPGARLTQADADLVAAINQASRDAEPPRAPRTPEARQPDVAIQAGAMPDTVLEAGRRQEAGRQAERDASQARRREEDRERRSVEERRADEVPTLPAGDGRANPVRLLLEYQVAATRSRVAALEQRRKELSEVGRLDGPRSQTLERLYSGEEELRRRDLDVRVAEKVFADLSERYEQARLQVAARSAELQVVDPALPPRRPVSWRAWSVAIVAGLIGGIVALGIVSLTALVRSWRLG